MPVATAAKLASIDEDSPAGVRTLSTGRPEAAYSMLRTSPAIKRAPALTASCSRNPSNPPDTPLSLPGSEPRNTVYMRMPAGTRSGKFFQSPWIQTRSTSSWITSGGTTRPCCSST